MRPAQEAAGERQWTAHNRRTAGGVGCFFFSNGTQRAGMAAILAQHKAAKRNINWMRAEMRFKDLMAGLELAYN